MLEEKYITRIIQLEGVIVTDIANEENILTIFLELARKEHTCPCCGRKTDRVHDYRIQRVKDIDIGRETVLKYRKRRYVCSCGKRFYEENSFLPRYYRLTSRLFAYIIQELKKAQSAKAVAQNSHLSTSTVLRYIDYISYGKRELPETLSIDEFKGNANKQKYQTILTDPQNRKILDILENRYENTLIQYFKRYKNRDKVKFFISDMNPHFREVSRVCFPNATIVADRYHVIRQSFWAMENVRKREQKRLGQNYRKFFKKSRYLLNKNHDILTEEEIVKLITMFELAPRLADAYRVHHEFLTVMKCKSKEEGKRKLIDWLVSVEVMDLPEFEACTKACHNWFEEILNSMEYPWSNGFTEGCNNKTKVLKRVCYGIQRFDRLRTRILHCAT